MGLGLLLAAMLLMLLVASSHASAQALQPPDAAAGVVSSEPEISLLTIGPGDLFFERFGHNAIVVRDRVSGSAVAYNYGIFDFGEGGFFANFARGTMTYRIAADDLADDVAMYRDEHRSIVEQRLNLAADQVRALVEFLEWNARPENAYYRYDYFTANCSTRVRDALDKALGGILHAQSHGRSRGYSYRLDALRLMSPQPVLMLLIDLGLGPYADQRLDFWQESFVPASLQTTIAQVQLGTSADAMPLLAATDVVSAGSIEEPPALPPDLRWPLLGAGLALGAAVLWLARSSRRVARIPLMLFATAVELFCGVGGLLLLFLWFGSEHRSAWSNENLLLLNPLCLLLVPAWALSARARWRPGRLVRGTAWLIVLCASFALFSKILPWFVQANLHWILFFLPIHVALAIVLARAHDRHPDP